MSEFVEIKTSVSDIMSIANRLRAQGDGLTDTLGTTTEQITTLENHPETLPDDDFTREFTKTYKAPTEGGDGTPANQAVKEGAVAMGEALTGMGDAVVDAMWAYSGQDDENATDVAGANNA